MNITLVTRVVGRCRKCGGNMFEEKDQYGGYVACLQCGCIEEPEPIQIDTTRLTRGLPRKKGIVL